MPRVSAATSTPGYFLFAAWTLAPGPTTLRNAAIAALYAATMFVLGLVAPRVRDRGSARGFSRPPF